MINANNTLYDKRLCNLTSTYVIDGKCVKSRQSSSDIDKSEILKRVRNFENIGIQKGNQVVIYCDEQLSNRLKSIMNMNDDKVYPGDTPLMRAFGAGKVVIISQAD